jgi:carbohydrate kinase (thermoresistant glucokinase family)
LVIVVMGPSGSGKSTVGALLASRLGWPFVEGDDYHTAANVEKMRAGTPLTDADREPWLAELAVLIRDWHSRGEDAVLACSALRHAYREKLGFRPGIVYVYLKGTPEQLHERLQSRQRHFAGPSLLDSQLTTLEEPDADEPAIVLPISLPAEDIARSVVEALAQRWRLFRNVRPSMLSPNDKVTIRYRDATGFVIEQGWTVLEYDDGLVKLQMPAATYREGSDPAGVRTIPARTKVVNMRSFDFLSADIE